MHSVSGGVCSIVTALINAQADLDTQDDVSEVSILFIQHQPIHTTSHP